MVNLVASSKQTCQTEAHPMFAIIFWRKMELLTHIITRYSEERAESPCELKTIKH